VLVIFDDMGAGGVVTFAAFTCQPLGATNCRIEENQRFREPDDTAEPLENRLFLASVTMPSAKRTGANTATELDTTPRYDVAAAKEAWRHALDWFNKYLRG
jgi:hypothetical protein